ncbi:UNKNOWN [Stylonychia lemnae]|uniref:PX domain-containing protein n=1 Tax=Stylonychia lemnae TaxID=5949 RepID=A0A078B4K8_STYLE|nr:UNKNOWN [Stylonychia lemnae]|eukprot:CDW88433.1 UNKNOWN [Stylonychia lemnae]
MSQSDFSSFHYQLDDNDDVQTIQSSYFQQKKCCFTENYLVFSLNERMPQMTELYLDKEDDVLDFCKKVIFQPSSRTQSNVFQVISDPNNEEQYGLYENKDRNASQYMEQLGPNGERQRRYSIIVESNILAYSKRQLSYLSKSITVINSSANHSRRSSITSGRSTLTKQNSQILQSGNESDGYSSPEKVKGKKTQRDRSHILIFTLRVNEAKAVERTIKDFLDLRLAFARAFPGCYIPKIIPVEVQTVINLDNQLYRICLNIFLIKESQKYKPVQSILQSKTQDKFRIYFKYFEQNLLSLNSQQIQRALSTSVWKEELAKEDANDASIFRSDQKACDRFNDMNVEMQMNALNTLNDFVRDELSDCESFNEAMKEIKRLSLQRTEIKSKLDRSLEQLSVIDRKMIQRYKQAKYELEIVSKALQQFTDDKILA